MYDIEYIFYEWLIIHKKITSEEFKKINLVEFEKLKIEFLNWYYK